MQFSNLIAKKQLLQGAMINICFIENTLKMMKNAFYFILKTLFVLKIFKFLS